MKMLNVYVDQNNTRENALDNMRSHCGFDVAIVQFSTELQAQPALRIVEEVRMCIDAHIDVGSTIFTNNEAIPLVLSNMVRDKLIPYTMIRFFAWMQDGSWMLLEMDEDGEFDTQWPCDHGFFEWRMDLLM